MITDWHLKRSKSITGTDIAKIYGISKFQTARDLYFAKINNEQISDNLAMWLGRELEPVVAKRFSLDTSFKLIEPESNIEHAKHPYFIANPDYYCIDDKGEKCILEIKTTRTKKDDVWGEEYSEQIPDDYLCQIMWYLYVCNLNTAYLAVLFGGQTLGIYKHTRDKEFEKKIVKSAYKFYAQHLIKRIPPPVEYHRFDYDYKEYEPRDGEKVCTKKEILDMVNVFKENERLIKELKEAQEEIKKSLKEYAESAEVLKDKMGKTIATIKIQTRKTLDTARVKQEHPEIYEQYFKETQSEVIRINTKGEDNG